MDDEKKPSTPVMDRSRNQLASAYAPGAFFTFEGGLGACIAIPDSQSEYEPARIPESAKKQIVMRLAEIARSWFTRAIECRPANSAHPVHARMCVDPVLLDSNGQVTPPGFDQLQFVNPVKMGYAPAPLTFVCNTCGLFRGFDSVAQAEKAMGDFRPRQCPNPKTKGKCQWRQLDVVFVHWSGHWEPATPGMFEWDSSKEDVRPPIRRCSQCDSEDFLLNTSSPSIGKWFFQCATCGHRERDTWLQNDPETLRVLREDFGDRVTDGRMEPISYRASAAFYPQSEQFIVFEEGEEAFLSILEQSRQADLEDFVARKFGFGATRPSMDEIKELLRQAGKYDVEWPRYEELQRSAHNARDLAARSPADSRRMVESFAQKFELDMRALVDSWFQQKFILERNELSKGVRSTIEQRSTIPSRFDPFVLAVEHEALQRNKLGAATAKSGRRAFVRFTALDTDLALRNTTEKERVERETRRLLDLMGVDEMGLIREFDLCRFTYGFTRVQSVPEFEKRNTRMPVRLNLFPSLPNRKRPIYAITQANEAIYVRLKPEETYQWLRQIGVQDIFEWNPSGKEKLGGLILERTVPFERFLSNIKKHGPASTYLYVYTLLHTYAHVLMKAIAEHSGLDLGSLGEYLFPADLACVVYRSGTTMDLGNLSSLWRNENVHFLGHLLDQKTLMCSSGSLCAQQGGACPDCIMIPETSCIAQNQLLSRAALRGGNAPREDGDHQNQEIRGYIENVHARLTRRAS